MIGIQRAYRTADYITVNLSSPNTKGLRKLQEEVDKDFGTQWEKLTADFDAVDQEDAVALETPIPAYLDFFGWTTAAVGDGRDR